MRTITLLVTAAALLGTACSIRSERVVETPVATERTVVHDMTTVPTTTTVYTR